MTNRWLAHVKETARKNRGMKFKEVLKHAKKTYKRLASSLKKTVKRRGAKKSRKRSKRKSGGNPGMHTHRTVTQGAAPVSTDTNPVTELVEDIYNFI